jgi:hypothetical protein
MKPHEVINRWFDYGGYWAKPLTFSKPNQGGFCDCIVIRKDNGHDALCLIKLNDLKPIRLTPEILFKLGYEKDLSTQKPVFYKDGVLIHDTGNGYNLVASSTFKEQAGMPLYNVILYFVNQLEDLHRVLTGKDLNFIP